MSTSDIMKLAKLAVAADSKGNKADAVHNYVEAATLLAKLEKEATPEKKVAYAKKAQEYLARATEIKRTMAVSSSSDSGNQPDQSQEKSMATEIGGALAAATASTWGALKSINTEYKISEKVGIATKATYAKGVELDEKHKIIDKTKAAGVQTWNAAAEFEKKHEIGKKTKETGIAAYHKGVELEKKYEVGDKLKQGATSVVNSAKKVEEDHQVTKKLSNIASAAWLQTKAFNTKYKVTDTIGTGLVTGLNMASEAATSVIAKSEDSSGSKSNGGDI